MLTLARHVSAADRSMKAGAWEKKAFVGSELVCSGSLIFAVAEP